MIGLAVASLTDPMVPPLLRAMERPVLGEGLIPIIVETNNDSVALERTLGMLSARLVDGFIMTCVRAADYDMVAALDKQVPVVLAIRRFERGGLHGIVHDDAYGAEAVAAHFAELGHRIVAQSPGPDDMSTFHARRLGFSNGCRRFNLNEVVIDATALNYEPSEGMEIGRELIERNPEVTAIFAPNDAVGIGVIRAIRELGLTCPDDISVAGYNDAPLSDMISPALTTVRVAVGEVGAQASQRLLQLIAEPDLPAATMSVLPDLIVRDSTGPARSQR